MGFVGLGYGGGGTTTRRVRIEIEEGSGAQLMLPCRSSGQSITSVSLADVFATCQISLFLENLQVNFISGSAKLPIAKLNVLACALQLETSATGISLSLS
jgi:hypothetical protein